jgi:tetratricopeptide (TPR) repeat protein
MVGGGGKTPSLSVKKDKVTDVRNDSVKAAFAERALLLVELWQAGRVREMREVSQGSDFLHPVVLELHAKAAYLVFKQEGRQTEPDAVHHFIDCWLSFLFHPALFYSFANGPETPEDRKQYRLELLDIGESMVRKYAEQQLEQGTSFIRHWEEDYRLLTCLCKILSKEKKEEEDLLLYVPTLAWQAGIAEKIFNRVRKAGQENRTEQEGCEHYEKYLAAGAWYSPIGPSLLVARNLAEKNKDADDVFTALKQDVLHQKSMAKKDDLFFSYGLARLMITCGLYALEQEEYAEAENILRELLPLPPHAGALKQELLIAFGLEDHYVVPEWLSVTVTVLSELHEHSPCEAVKKTFCSVLTHQAVFLHNTKSIESKALLESLEKAVSLNPDDAFARMTLDDVRMDAEICSLHKTMSAGKLNKASKIAQKSSYPEVADQFFIFAAQVIEQVEAGDYPDDQSAFFMVRQLLEGALEVDAEHAMIEELSVLVDELEERLEGL